MREQQHDLQASSELDAEVKKLSSERQRLASEVQMKREMEQQYAKRCTLQVHVRLQCRFESLHAPPTDACFPFFWRARPLLLVVKVVTSCLNLPVSYPTCNTPPSSSPGPPGPPKWAQVWLTAACCAACVLMWASLAPRVA